jgi:hypothetical protein
LGGGIRGCAMAGQGVILLREKDRVELYERA